MNLQFYDWIIILAVPILAYIIGSRKRDGNTWRGYFLANSQMSPLSAGATYIGANLTFTSIFLIVSEESYKRGIWAFTIPIFWILGTIVFILLYPKIKAFTSKSMTLHQAIGSVFKSPSIKMYASFWTIIAFLGTVALEYYGGIKLLKAAGIPMLTNLSIALILVLAVTAFTAKGGFRGVARADIFLDIILLFGTILLGLGLVEFVSNLVFNSQSLSQLQIGIPPPLPNLLDNVTFVIAMFIIFVPFQLCTLDSWQRVSAAEKSEKSPTKFLLIGTIILALAYCIPIFIGIQLRGKGIIIPEDSFALFEFIKFLNIPPAMIGIILAGFIAAIISTADELLNCCSLSFLFDALGIERVDKNRDEKDEIKLISSGKFYTGVAGFVAALIALGFVTMTYIFKKDISDIALAVFSGQIVFTIPLFYVFFNQDKAPRIAKTIKWSMIFSFITSITLVFIGWISKDKVFSDSAPIGGFVVAALIVGVISPFYSFIRNKYFNNV